VTEPHTVSFTITVDDVVGFLKLQQQTLNRVGLALGLAALLVGAGYAAFAADLFSALWFGGIGIVILIAAGTDVFDRWRVQRGARSLIGSTASFTLDDEGIASETITGSGRVPWSSVTRLLQSDRTLLIKRDRVPVAWIPTRAFASPDELNATVAFIQGKLAKSL
jgi:hypothetical protein